MPDFNGLTITEVRITLVDDAKHEALKAFVSIELSGSFALKRIRIIETKSGRMLLSMPNRKLPEGGFRDVFFPTTQPARRWMEDAVFAAYGAELRRVADERLAALKAAG